MSPNPNELLLSIVQRACELEASHWGEAPKAAWGFVFCKVQGRVERRPTTPETLLRYARLQAKKFYWREWYSCRRQANKPSGFPDDFPDYGVQLDSLIWREVVESCQHLPLLLRRALFARYQIEGNVPSLAREK